MAGKYFSLYSMDYNEGIEWIRKWCNTCYHKKEKCRPYLQSECGFYTDYHVIDNAGQPACKKYKPKKRKR